MVSYKKEEKKLGLGGLLIGTLLVYILFTTISCCPLLSLACFDIFILSSWLGGENFNVGGNNNYETIELKDPCACLPVLLHIDLGVCNFVHKLS